MPPSSTVSKRPFPWGMILVWIVFSCLLSGMVAAVFNMPSLWGGSIGVFEYMLPLPLSWGMLHYPSLAFFGFLLVLARSNKDQWLSIVQRLCMGSLLAVLSVVIFNDELRGFPLLMYFSVDATTALIFTVFIRRESATPKIIHPPLNILLILGPSILALLMLFTAPMFMDRYNFAKSDTTEINSKHDVVQFWLYLNRSAGKPERECSYLKRYAEKRKNSYPRSNGLRHRRIILFTSKEALRAGSQNNAWVSYEWWPDGRTNCSADPDFK